MSFKDEMELLRLERLTAISKNRDMRIYLHTRKLADLDTAEANGALPSEDIEYSRARENREYEYDMASFQSALDDLNPELDLPRITPEMLAIWQAYQARLTDDEPVYPSEMHRFQAELWAQFEAMMDGGEG